MAGNQTKSESTLIKKVGDIANVMAAAGVGFTDYITQLTYILFLKMDEEKEEMGLSSSIPDGYKWKDLVDLNGTDLIDKYRGFSLFVNFNPFERDIILRGALLYGTDIGNSGQGTITRIENLAERIPNYLEDARRELKETQKQLAVAKQQVGQPFLYEEELSEKVAQLTEINTKLEFESLQESEVILDENGQRSDGEEDWDSERVPACASAEV